MEIAIPVVIATVALAIWVVIGILDAKAYHKRMKALQLRDETQAMINVVALALLHSKYPDALNNLNDHDKKDGE